MDRIRKEPALLIGALAAGVLVVIQSLAGAEVVSPNIANTVIGFFDNITTEAPLDGWGYPLVAGAVIRFFVFSPPTVAQVAATAAATGNPTVNVTPP